MAGQRRTQDALHGEAGLLRHGPRARVAGLRPPLQTLDTQVAESPSGQGEYGLGGMASAPVLCPRPVADSPSAALAVDVGGSDQGRGVRFFDREVIHRVVLPTAWYQLTQVEGSVPPFVRPGEVRPPLNVRILAGGEDGVLVAGDVGA